ncbi:LIM and cysteine-rich domains protein 1, partial [Opisthocomus hoazin]
CPVLFQMSVSQPPSGRGVPCLRCRGTCAGFEPHSWRKICKSCKCSQEDHSLSSDVEDDRKIGRLLSDSKYATLTARVKGGDGIRIYKRNRMIITNPIVSRKDPTFDTITYEWAPPGLTQKLVRTRGAFGGRLSREKGHASCHGSILRAERRLAEQRYDQDPSQCRGLAEGELKLMEDFVKKYKAEALGVGEVALPGQGGTGKEEGKPQDKDIAAGKATESTTESTNGAPERSPAAGHYVRAEACETSRRATGSHKTALEEKLCRRKMRWSALVCSLCEAESAGLAVLLCSGWAGWWESVTVCLSIPQIIFSEDYQQAEGRAWHKKHFACLECETLLAGKTFALHDGSLLCATRSKR